MYDSVQRKFFLVGDMTSSTYDVSIWHKSKILTEHVAQEVGSNYAIQVFTILCDCTLSQRLITNYCTSIEKYFIKLAKILQMC